MDELPVGTVTFLFTDIEGSTRLLKQWRDQYAEALGEHQRILRDAFADHGGHEIDTQGDSFFVAFRRATEAVAAAAACQRRLAEQEWPEGGVLRIRVGIHTGEPAAAPGARYVGVGVHRAARICAAAHGGQVLVSQTTRELLRDDPLPDVSLRDLGEHQLKDMDEPERLYQLVAPGLEDDFPPLKTAAPAPFAGREGELAEAVAEELAKPWRRPGRRTLIAATFAAAAIGTTLGVLLTVGGGSSGSAAIKANSVGVIEQSSGKLDATVHVGSSPGGVAAGEGAVWVANTDDNDVSRIDQRTNEVRQTIQVGRGPTAVDTGGGAVWVTNGLDGTVSRIDPTTNRMVQTIRVGNGPVGVAYGARAVWVTNTVDGTVSRIDPVSGRVTRTVPTVPGATGVAVGFGRVWVVSPSSGVVVTLDATSGGLIDRVPVGVDPVAVAVGAGAVWVANRADGTVYRIAPRAPTHVTAVIAVGRFPDSVAAVKDGVWVANEADGTVMRIDASNNRVVKTDDLANLPQQLAVSGRSVFVAVRSAGLEHRGGTLRVSSDAPDSIDPALAYSASAWAILAVTNDGLVGFRRVGGIEGVQLVPDLAVSLPTPTDDGKTYTFRLRPGVRYSTGRLVEPADFRAELERVLEIAKPRSPGRQYYAGIAGAGRCELGKACDLSRGIVADAAGRTVTFHLSAPDADFLAKLALPFAAAVPGRTPAHDVGSHAVPATGPYVVVAYRPTRSARLVRNPKFRERSEDAQPDGYPDEITFAFRGDGSSPILQVRAVERRVADVAADLARPPLPKEQLAALATRSPSQLHFSPTAETTYFFLNTRVAPFDDLRVRRAVNEVFDRQAFMRVLGLGFAPTCQILPPNYPSYHRTCLYGSGGAAAVDRARRLVRSAGRAGATVTVWAPSPRAIEGRFMVSVLNRLGLRARLKTAGVDAYFTRAFNSRARMQTGYSAWFADFPSDAGYLPPQFSCVAFIKASPQTNQDPSGFCDPAVDRLLSAAARAQAQNPAAAPALWQQAERAILAQAPVVPTYNKEDVAFVSKRVGNFQYHPQWGVLLDQLWVR